MLCLPQIPPFQALTIRIARARKSLFCGFLPESGFRIMSGSQKWAARSSTGAVP